MKTQKSEYKYRKIYRVINDTTRANQPLVTWRNEDGEEHWLHDSTSMDLCKLLERQGYEPANRWHIKAH